MTSYADKKVTEKKTYLFGPVPSRRLGLSLGVDIVPFKLCPLDCVYCQLGPTMERTLERKEYVPIEPVLDELKKKLAQGLRADFITLSGSGEPTLNSQLGELIDGIKKITDIPVAILTNSTLLWRSDVRADCTKADVVLPSLDAADESTFQKINRPHKDISLEKLINGLCAFRKEYTGRIWLEVFLVEGLNTNNDQIAAIKDIIGRINPDKIQLNTAVRPTAETGVKRLDKNKLELIAKNFGEKCEVVASWSATNKGLHGADNIQHDIGDTILSVLKRRPCSLNDICSSLSVAHNEALKHIAHLQEQGLVHSEKKDGTIFFRANLEPNNPNHPGLEVVT